MYYSHRMPHVAGLRTVISLPLLQLLMLDAPAGDTSLLLLLLPHASLHTVHAVSPHSPPFTPRDPLIDIRLHAARQPST